MKKNNFLILIFSILTSPLLFAQVTAEMNEDYFGQGGELKLNSEVGATNIFLQPDFDGTGGWISVTNGNGVDGFWVDGNNTSNQTQVRMTGTSTSLFNTFNTGNSSVVLPGNAISASETLDEAGVAAAHGPSVFNFANAVGTITSRSITVPADGYILAFASGQLNLNHSPGTNTTVEIGISDNNASLPSNMDVGVSVPSAAGSGFYISGSVAQGVFEVTAGTHTFYFLGQLLVGNAASMNEGSLTLLYVPTMYGTTTTNLDDGGEDDTQASRSSNKHTGMTAEAIKQERVQSLMDNQERMQKELDELKATLKEYTKEGPPNGNK